MAMATALEPASLAGGLGEDGLQGLTRAVKQLDARMGSVMQDLSALKERFEAHLVRDSAVPSTTHEDILVQARIHAAKDYSELAEDVEDVHERLSRLELLLFRLPMPDFAQLDRAIAQLPLGRAGTMSPMESVPEEQQLLDTEIIPQEPQFQEQQLVDVDATKNSKAEDKAPGNLNDSLLEELGIFNDYDAYKTARTGLSAGGSGTSSEEGSDESSGDDQPERPQWLRKARGESLPLAAFNIHTPDKKSESEDSDPERPRRRTASAATGSDGRMTTASGLRIKVVATKRVPKGEKEAERLSPRDWRQTW